MERDGLGAAKMKSFDSFGGLAKHLLETVVAQHEMQQKGLEKAARVVEKRAKEKIGEYQDQVGPFIAWPELADSTKADRLRKGFSEDEPLLRTGAMRDSIEHMVVDNAAYVGSNSDIAVFQELGTSKMPPRSFLGGALAEKTDDVCEIIGESTYNALIGKDVVGGKMEIGDV
jgi:HK97 gp10 family phage protein